MFGIAPEMQADAEIVHLKGCTQMCWHTNSCNIAPGALSSPLCSVRRKNSLENTCNTPRLLEMSVQEIMVPIAVL
eukprot:s719_g10.t1